MEPAPGYCGLTLPMNASAFEFRHRFWFIMAFYILGFATPWNWALHLDGSGPNTHVWGRLAVLLSKGGSVGIGMAFNAVLAAAILCALAGAFLRTWGSAYLGTSVMRDTEMHSEHIVADGPYRRVRNPLYFGSWVFTLVLALLMPASGAIFTLATLVFFQIRLILAEEASLALQLGKPYTAYCAQVPRLVPALTPRVPSSGARPRWGEAFLAEIFMWGVTASFAVFGWQYNASLLIRCVLVSLGASLIVRALQMQSRPAA
jgi:protein-S-isoprenylcysteine O-methyltransferase Ste14